MGLFPHRVIPKTLEMGPVTFSLGAQHTRFTTGLSNGCGISMTLGDKKGCKIPKLTFYFTVFPFFRMVKVVSMLLPSLVT